MFEVQMMMREIPEGVEGVVPLHEDVRGFRGQGQGWRRGIRGPRRWGRRRGWHVNTEH